MLLALTAGFSFLSIVGLYRFFSVGDFNPYAEESTLFLDGLLLPIGQAILEPDFGYSAAPIHLLWRGLDFFHQGNIPSIVRSIRIMGPLLAIYCTARSLHYLSTLHGTTRADLVLLLFYNTVYYTSDFPGILVSFQFPYIFAPLIATMIAENIYGTAQPDNSFLSPSKNKGSPYEIDEFRSLLLYYTHTLFRAIDKLFVLVCVFTKPVLAPMAISYFASYFFVNFASGAYSKHRASVSRKVDHIFWSFFAVCALIVQLFIIRSNLTNILDAEPVVPFSTLAGDGFQILRNYLRPVFAAGKQVVHSLVHSLIAVLVAVLPILLLRQVKFLASINQTNQSGNGSSSNTRARSILSAFFLLGPWLLSLIIVISVGQSMAGWMLRSLSCIYPLIIFFLIRKDLSIKASGRLRNFLVGSILLFAFKNLYPLTKQILINTLHSPIQMISASTYLGLNPRLIGLSPSNRPYRCYFPGPENWNSPYILDKRYTCLRIPFQPLLPARSGTSTYVSLFLHDIPHEVPVHIDSFIYKLASSGLVNSKPSTIKSNNHSSRLNVSLLELPENRQALIGDLSCDKDITPSTRDIKTILQISPNPSVEIKSREDLPRVFGCPLEIRSGKSIYKIDSIALRIGIARVHYSSKDTNYLPRVLERLGGL
jgi:hypothetical protein